MSKLSPLGEVRPNPEQLLPKRRAAREFGVPLRWLEEGIEAGELQTYAVGAWPRLKRSEVRAWIEDQRVTGISPAARRRGRELVRQRLDHEGNHLERGSRR